MATTLNLWGVLSESKRIINAHSRHFLALSVLFLLPLSFSIIIYPTLLYTLSQPTTIHSQLLYFSTNSFSLPTLQSISLPFFYSLFLVLFSLLAVATISYSTFHGFYGRPVKIIAAIKSLFYSFVPLVVTTIVAQLLVALVLIALFVFRAVLIKGFEAISGLDVGYGLGYLTGFDVFLAVVFGLVFVWLQVNWALASVIVVVESKWGFEPLRRSYYLMKGMRWVSLSLVLFFGLFIGFWVWISATPLVDSGGVGDWRTWVFILQTVVSSGLVTLLMLQSIASNTILYMYCKALHGELAFEIAEEFARDYVSFPFDDEKAPHVVTVVQA